jgi:hypothetical protein
MLKMTLEEFRMYRLKKLVQAFAPWSGTAVMAIIASLAFSASAQAAVTATGDPADGYGAVADRKVFTVDPFSPAFGGPYAANIERGIANTRMLRQTFQNPTTFNVGQINLSFNVTGGSTVGGAGDTGLRLAFYAVDDVLAGSWLPVGAPIKEITLQPGNMPGSDQVLRFNLTSGDVFSLPQRNTGAAGYGLEISTPNSLASDGNPGTIKFTNDGVNPDPVTNPSGYYAGGRYYTELGNASTSYRDIGLSILASTEVACDPGDVNCMGGVTIADLEIIAANFRTSGGRELGDLTGDGFIDFNDFGQWKDNYSGPGLAASAFSFLSVPEPTSTLPVLNGILAFAFSSRRRRRNS